MNDILSILAALKGCYDESAINRYIDSLQFEDRVAEIANLPNYEIRREFEAWNE